MRFKKITEDDKAKIYELYAKQKTLGTEYSLVTLFQWHIDYNVEAAIGEDYICFRLFFHGKLLYFPPLTCCKRRFCELLDELIAAGATDFAEITDASLPEFCRRNYNIEPDRDMAEYVYLAKSFIHLPGKALHAKRNHIAQFQNAYRYLFAGYEERYKDGIERLFDQWINEKSSIYDTSNAPSSDAPSSKSQFLEATRQEKKNVLTILDDLAFFNCFADVLLVDDRVIGFSVGEILPTGVGAVFFEKADTRYDGAYTMLSNLFAKKHFSDITYINRQEDMGDEGLRRAKLSYSPKYIFMKYVASPKIDSGDHFGGDVITLYQNSFPEDSKETIDYFFQNIFSAKRMKTIRVGDRLASALHIVFKTLDYEGKLLKLPYIVALATDQNFKNMGYARRLVEETLRCLKSQKSEFVALYPAIEGFYEKFGFEKVFYRSEDDYSLLDASKVERKATNDIAQLKEIFDKKTAPYEVKIVRDQKQTELRLGTESGANLLYLGNTLIGYELLDSNGERSEVCILPSAKAFDPTENRTEAPSGMARIVDIESAFALLHLKNRYKFKLTDCVFAENNGVYEAYANTVIPGEGFDFSLTERQLCALFFGQSAEGVPKAFLDEFPKLVFVPDKY